MAAQARARAAVLNPVAGRDIVRYVTKRRNDPSLRDLTLALKAAADPTRTRILKLLERGGLCGCQIQAVLGLAASTVSRHLSILKSGHLVEDRRRGRWIEYRLADESDLDPGLPRVLAVVRSLSGRDATVLGDHQRLREVKKIALDAICRVSRVPRATRGGRAAWATGMPATPPRGSRGVRARSHG